MPLQFQVETLDNVDEALKSLYTEQDGKFVLGIEGLPKDNSAEYEERIQQMDAKVNELLGEKKKADQKRREAEELAAKEAEEAARKSGDWEALDRSWSEKSEKQLSDLRAELEPQIATYKDLLHRATVDTTATQMAADLAVQGSSSALLPHIAMRLAMEVKDNKAVTVVTGPNGEPSALTLDELKNEITNNPALAPLIVGNKASGGGADGGNSGGAAPQKGNMGGNRSDRVAAISSRFPDLKQAN